MDAFAIGTFANFANLAIATDPVCAGAVGYDPCSIFLGGTRLLGDTRRFWIRIVTIRD
jgi:hypothetical protein